MGTITVQRRMGAYGAAVGRSDQTRLGAVAKRHKTRLAAVWGSKLAIVPDAFPFRPWRLAEGAGGALGFRPSDSFCCPGGTPHPEQLCLRTWWRPLPAADFGNVCANWCLLHDICQITFDLPSSWVDAFTLRNFLRENSAILCKRIHFAALLEEKVR